MVRRIVIHFVFLLAGIVLLQPNTAASNPPLVNREATQIVREHDDYDAPPIRTGRRPTVADLVEMTRVAGSSNARLSYSGSLSVDVAFFSPDRKRFALVLKRGNLRRNTNDYSLFVFDIRNGLKTIRRKHLVSFSSSSNREAINQVTWLADNNTILFVGGRPGEKTQLYSVKCNSKRLVKLSRHATNVLSYSSTPHANRIVYAAEERESKLTEQAEAGVHVSNQPLSDLISGHFPRPNSRLYVIENGKAKREPLNTHEQVIDDPVELFISPDGRYLVVRTNVTEPSRTWMKYKDATIEKLVRRNRSPGEPSWLFRYELVDLATGSSRSLLDAPISNLGSDVLWEPNSRAVILTGVYLPLTDCSAELLRRESHTFVVEVKVPSLDVTEISDRELKLTSLDPTNSLLKLNSRLSDVPETIATDCYRKTQNQWKPEVCGARNESEITVVQNLNSPPRIAAINPATGQTTIILDLNPQFRHIHFGEVKKIVWRGGNGTEVAGGLYLPPDYVSGRRYPLVIQTNGFEPHQFWIDGPFAAAFAAQALAANDFVVLQIPDGHYSMDTPEEAPLMAETYENAIDDLYNKGIIDTKRVGIIAFSRTGLYVRYMLTHERHHLAAAVIADGFDDGLWAYIAYVNESSYFGSELEELVGAPPFGEGLRTWLSRSSEFLLDKVNTPIQVQVNDSGSLLGNWDWFVGLKRLHKPVELLYFPDGTHILEKPSEQRASKQAVVDWFCYWLKHEGTRALDSAL
jgi:dipeptidyl aminopeptidase/acylaminoacyl peptidase